MPFSTSASIALKMPMAPALHRGRWFSSIAAMLLRAAQAYSIWFNVAHSWLARQSSGLLNDWGLKRDRQAIIMHACPTWKCLGISWPLHGAWSSTHLPMQQCSLTSHFLLADPLRFYRQFLQTHSKLLWQCTARKSFQSARNNVAANRFFVQRQRK